MIISLRQIRYFLVVAEELHFRRASARLLVAQPALTRAIKNLEISLDVTLFNRTNRTVELTTAGEILRDGCSGLIASLEHTITQTKQAHLGRRGTLRISFTDNAITGALPKILKSFQNKAPDIEINPFNGSTTEQLRRLELNEIDVGFVTGPINIPGIEVAKIQSERFFCITYAEHSLANRNSIRLKELSEEDFVLGLSIEWGHFHAHLFSMCRRVGFEPKVVQNAYNTAGIMGLVAGGLGLTILTENATVGMPNGLVAIEIEDIEDELQTFAVWRSGDQSGPTALFLNHLGELEGR